MKVFLLHRDHDFDPAPELRDEIFDAMVSGHLWSLSNIRRDLARRRNVGMVPPTSGQHEEMVQDLELETLWRAMAAGDEFVFEAAKRVMLSSLREPPAIVYRQRVLADCSEHPAIVRELYELAIEALGYEREAGSLWASAGPDTILHRSVKLLQLYVGALRRLRQIADEHLEHFSSEGFGRLFAMLRGELADEYLDTVEGHLRGLEFRRGVLESAKLGKGDRGRVTPSTSHRASRAGKSGSRSSAATKRRNTASNCIPAMRPAPGRWRRSGAKGSTRSPMRLRDRPITSKASSTCSGSSSPSISAA